MIRDLRGAGFVDKERKGSHKNFKHPDGVRITLSGGPGADAKPYQERAVREAIEATRK